jgi:hypothetical protein
LVRTSLATKVNSNVTLNATYGGIHLPKGGNFIGKTLLFTDVTSFPKGELVTNHMWVQVSECLQYESFNKGDRVLLIGTVIKYYKYGEKKPKKDYSINIISCTKCEDL